MLENNYGIWVGKDATVALIDEFRISYLRISKDCNAAVLYHTTNGIVSTVYGYGTHADVNSNLGNHKRDDIAYDEINGKLVYTMYDGTVYDLVLAEKITMADFDVVNEIDNTLPLTEKMTLWSVGKCFEVSDDMTQVMIDTRKYSILYSFSIPDNYIYCRVGQNGYCEKGRAMISPTCIRTMESRMIEDNLQTLNDYQPMKECFVADGCAFPRDGGWYWSVKEVTDDVIFLNGCNGDIYEIRRLR